MTLKKFNIIISVILLVVIASVLIDGFVIRESQVPMWYRFFSAAEDLELLCLACAFILAWAEALDLRDEIKQLKSNHK